MAVPHGPAGVGTARRRMREELLASGVQDTVVDDAVLVLSELLSNSCRHARPIDEDRSPYADQSPQSAPDAARERSQGAPSACVRASWRIDGQGRLIVAVTDGGGPTRPVPATPSVTAHGGRGLAIIRSLAKDWGVRDTAPGEVTVWAALSLQGAFATRVDLTADLPLSLRKNGTNRTGHNGLPPHRTPGLAFPDLDDLT
ncbi:hypothetical protein GR130_39000 [Streptomyces sp. GS7]|nr:hypothetical protein GR130_39000 [Streptomyces sp. GS7]